LEEGNDLYTANPLPGKFHATFLGNCHDPGGARVAILETMSFWLVLIWTPGVGLMAYLLLRRSPETD
jgi:hypothetical protein